jgi:hypothetical protein
VDRMAGALEILVWARGIRKRGHAGIWRGGRSSGSGDGVRWRSTAAGGELRGSSGGGRLKFSVASAVGNSRACRTGFPLI